MALAHKKKMAVIILIPIFFVAFDRFLKVLASQYLNNEVIALAPPVLSFHFVKNYQIALSLPFSGILLLVFIYLIIFVLLAYWLKLYKKLNFKAQAGLTFLIIGAISNLTDRLLYGYVIDYFDLRIFTNNIADMMIVGGAICMAMSVFLVDKNLQTEKRDNGEEKEKEKMFF